MMPSRHIITIVVTALSLLTHISSTRDTISPTTSLAFDETLISANGEFALGFFTPPNSTNSYVGLWYNKIPETPPTIVWVANRDNPATNSTSTLSLTPTGNLTIPGIWSTTIPSSLSHPVAQLLNSGNLVIIDSSGRYAWQGFDHPTDTLIPGMKLGVDFRSDGVVNRTLVAWSSYNDPSSGQYYAYMDVLGDPGIYFCQRPGRRIWRSGAWDGSHLSGIPGSSIAFVNNATEVAFSYKIDGQSFVSRLVTNSTGYIQRALWVWGTGQWNNYWLAPQDTCDNIGSCGPFGLCDVNNSPPCECLVQQGFTPKNPLDWNYYRNGQQGCMRKTKLDCVNGTDGFVTVSNVKLPQSENAVVDMGLSLNECEIVCKDNCSCTAYASADIAGSGSGCLYWVGELYDVRNYAGDGQDLYVRLAVKDLAPLPSQSHSSRSTEVAIAVSIVAAMLLLIVGGCLLCKRYRKRMVLLGAATSFNDQSPDEETREGDLDLPLFDFDTIYVATNYFSVANKLGEGGFGPVYKGTLGDNQEIAVKRLAKTSTQGVEEFKNEVMLISKLQHRNLVRLLGCCIKRDERMLVYEYMPNRSLDTFLFERGREELLDWKTRFQIIMGIARGLLYLHQDSRFRIIHRDLKASNILLDKDMDPKISDFGMARIFGGDETDFNTRKVVGTYGYMSPEYAMDGVFSVKSDVFSFGVLVLEIISGKKNRGVYAITPHINLVSHAWSLWKERKSLQLVDESMSFSFSTDEVLKCFKLSLLCVQEKPEDRPLMSSVLLMLGSDVKSLPQPKEPGFATRRGPLNTESSSSNQESCTLISMSITMFDGR